jgi:hypothetical protein
VIAALEPPWRSDMNNPHRYRMIFFIADVLGLLADALDVARPGNRWTRQLDKMVTEVLTPPPS